MPLVIFVAMAVFAPGLVFLLLHVGHAIIEGIPPVGYVMMFLAFLTFARSRWFLTTQPAHIVVPGVLAWAASIFLLILWGGNKL